MLLCDNAEQKHVVFLTFWQATGLSMLATFGLVKDVRLIILHHDVGHDALNSILRLHT